MTRALLTMLAHVALMAGARTCLLTRAPMKKLG
jgi:hypothetical protein